MEYTINQSKTDHLSRPLNPIPDYVKNALDERDLWDAFHSRPAYQQNDYIGWITRAKRPDTVQKRLDQMLAELERGGVYMKMAHPALRRKG